MLLDCDGNELQVGDKIRRSEKCLHLNGWKIGIRICTIDYITSSNQVKLKNTESGSRATSIDLGWNPVYFRKVEKVEEDMIPCIRITPAQAEKMEIVPGKLTAFFSVRQDNTPNLICLLSSTGYTIGHFNSTILRDNAEKFIQLADALDKINFGRKEAKDFK